MQTDNPSERELVDRLDRQRGQLMQAADSLREPAHRVDQAERFIRRGLPVLPYAIAAIAVIGIAGTLLRGRRIKPAILIATGLDLWRLWKTYQLSSRAAAQRRALSHRPFGE